MELSRLTELLQTPPDLLKAIKAGKPEAIQDIYFEPELHSITDDKKRPDKIIQIPNGITDSTGKEGTSSKTEKVTRISLSFQKTIISKAVDFTVGVPIEIDSTPNTPVQVTMNEMVRKTMKDNKTSFKDSEICELMMKDTECAEIWYSESLEPASTYWSELGNGKFKMRLKVVAPSKGDILYPLYDNAGDMIAFGRGYLIKNGDKEIKKLDLYTIDKIYKYTKGDNDWGFDTETG